MTYTLDDAVKIPVDRVYLDLKNPRHKPLDTQDEVQAYLIKDEQVLQLAADIAKHGLNPLDLFAVVQNSGTGRTKTYTVAEGNRRLCAIKLLNDPDLAPMRKRKEFERLASGAGYIPNEIAALVFENFEDGKLWIERLHGGQQGGIGRKNWNAEQKNRFTGSMKNALAQAVLDNAEAHGFISAVERKGKLTTVQRYLGNPQMREAMGIDITNPDGVARTRPRADFNRLLQRFMIDLLEGTAHSRMNKEDIVDYSRELGAMEGLSSRRVTSALITDDVKPAKKKVARRPHPRPRTKLPYSREIDDAIRGIPSQKLESLYTSLTTIEYASHMPLLAVGLWAFIETLTALSGRQDVTDMTSFLSKNKLLALGADGPNDVRAIRRAVQNIAEGGNNTKHHRTSATFNGPQMANDIETIEKIIIALAKEAQQANGV